jgi:hypothetical protein
MSVVCVALVSFNAIIISFLLYIYVCVCIGFCSHHHGIWLYECPLKAWCQLLFLTANVLEHTDIVLCLCEDASLAFHKLSQLKSNEVNSRTE